jgi:hypothetical protein
METSDKKIDTKPPPTDEKKIVRPKRQYIKKKDRLKGIVVKEGPVIVKFD